MNDFEAKREEALRLLKASGMRESNYLPPIVRLLWRLGFQVPPPHFVGAPAVALVAGVFFGVTWAALMWLVLWRATEFSFVHALMAAALAGLLFGVSMSAYYAYGRKKHRLPTWNDLLASSRG